MDGTRFKTVIVGGGVAGLEGLLALRDLLGDRVDVEVIAPESDFVYRPLAVAEPFGHGPPAKLGLGGLIREAGGGHRRAALASIDPAAREVTTDGGDVIPYDALLVALGARADEAVPGALTYRGPADNADFATLLRELDAGAISKLVFAVPAGVRWALPIYELALLTSEHLSERGVDGSLAIVTPEPEPLSAFGHRASAGVESLLEHAGIELLAGVAPSSVRGGELVLMSGDAIAADRVVALPRLEVPQISGLPQGPHGFIGTDRFMRVETVSRVYAAGDATWFPIKQGGIAAQQADCAATAIATCVDPAIEAEPFQPVLRAALLTGGTPRYLRSRVGARDEASAAGDAPLWWPPSKIAGRHLAPFLAARAGGVEPGSTLEDRAASGDTDAGALHGEAVELALAGANADARSGDYRNALRWLELAESLALTLPPDYVRKRELWQRETTDRS